MNRTVQLVGLTALFLLMLGMTIYASSHQNLFTEFSLTGSPEWFKATLVDFYINQFILWLWVAKIEKNILSKLVWLILMICFGSMATTIYIIQRVSRNKPLLKKE